MRRNLAALSKENIAAPAKRRLLFIMICVLSVCTAFGVYSALMRPALSMEKSNLLLTADKASGVFGENLTAHVTATAIENQEETFFYLSARTEYAELADKLVFADGAAFAEVTAHDGSTVQLNRIVGADHSDGYWFQLNKGQSVSFDLPYRSILGQTTADGGPTDLDSFETGLSAGGVQEEKVPSDAESNALVRAETESYFDLQDSTGTGNDTEATDTSVETENGSAAPSNENPDTASVRMVTAVGTSLEEARSIAEADQTQEPDLLLLWMAASEDLMEQTLSPALYKDETKTKLHADDGTAITIRGTLPPGATAEAWPVAVQMDDRQVLAAYDITIYREDGSIFEPDDGQSIQVDIQTPALETAEDESVEVYHSPDSAENTEYDYIGQAQWQTSQTVSFSTGHFSTFVLVSPMAAAGDAIWDNRANGMTLHLFDYLSYQGPNGISDPSSETLRTLINTTNGQSGGTWRNLRFMPQGSTSASTQNYYTGDARARQGIVALTLDSNGYPVLSSAAGGESLRYLFDPTVSDNAGTTRVRYTYADVNKLFKTDSEGYVVYDSNTDYAYYNTNASSNPNREFVLQDTYQVNNRGVGFFPFDTYNTNNTNTGPTASGTPFNHHFGLTLSTKFKMPQNGKVNGKDMMFSFGGDDDMWVFIDDKLVLDIGGIHGRASGHINFANGEVVVETGTVAMNGSTVRGESTTLDAIFGANYFKADGTTEYTIKCFYLERGGYDSNLMLRMNFPLNQEIDLPVSKVWDDNGNSANKRPAAVTVRLFADGVNTGKTLTLNEANNWNGSFTGLPLFQSDGITEIQYTVQEDPVPGYSTSYGKNSFANTPLSNNNIWVPATSLTDGETYMLVYGTNQAVTHNQSTSSPALTASTIDSPVSTPSLIVDGTMYTSWIMQPNTARQWTASASASASGRFFLRSMATPQRYITYGGSGNTFTLTQNTDGSGGSGFSYNGNQRLSVTRSSTTSYLQNANRRTTSSGSATSYSLYRQINAVDGFIIVNTYVPVTANLNLVKTNEFTPTVYLPDVEFELYSAVEQPAGTWVKANEFPYASGATDSDGKLTLSNLIPGTYLLYETAAAQGYELPTNPWQVTVESNGALTVTGLSASGDGSYIITNKKLAAPLTVKKQWLNPDGTEKTSGLPDEIQVQLWSKLATTISLPSKDHTVDFYMKVKTPDGDKNVLVDSRQVAHGGKIQFYGYIWVAPETVKANNTTLISSDSIFIDGWLTVPIFNLENITTNQDVLFEFAADCWESSLTNFNLIIKDSNSPSSGGGIIYMPSLPNTELVDTVILNAANDWKWEWNNLPAQNGSGILFYYVEEIDPPPGYRVTYENNNGIAGGVITIINQTSFVLPETGGQGAIPYTMAGALFLLGAGLMYINKMFRKGGRKQRRI